MTFNFQTRKVHHRDVVVQIDLSAANFIFIQMVLFAPIQYIVFVLLELFLNLDIRGHVFFITNILY
jgi:hypothetical protein